MTKTITEENKYLIQTIMDYAEPKYHARLTRHISQRLGVTEEKVLDGIKF